MKQRNPFTNRFKDKVAVVTGGSFGIGKAVVEELCKEGAKVAFSGLPEDGSGEAEKEFKSKGYDILFFEGDMSDETFCDGIVEKTIEKWGKINYLVNNAFSFNAKGLDSTRQDWERVFNVGPVAYAKMVQNVVVPMKKSGGGAIVNMSSISAFIAQPNRWTYNAAKGAVNTLTKCQALDLAPFGIRVNSVSPGWVWTREVDKAAGGDRNTWEKVWGDYHMLERCGEPVEVAAAILFLLSDDASFITGSNLPVDGGYQSLGSEGIGKTSQFAGSN